MPRGTDRDNPRLPESRQFWRRFLDRLGYITGLAWGQVTGTLSDQTDLQSALDAKVDDGDVTASGLTMTDATLLGRNAGSDGAVQQITLGTNLSFSGTTLNASGGGSSAWGGITGTLSDQTDLQTELDGKADDGDVTASGLTITDQRLLGRNAGSDGAIQAITLGSGLSWNSGAIDADVTQAELDAKADASAAPEVGESTGGNPITSMSSTSLVTLDSFTIPANTMPGRKVRIVLAGDVVQNSGASQNVQWRFSLGGSAIHDSSNSHANSANTALWRIELELSAPTTGKQFLVGQYRRSAQAAATTGISNIAGIGADGVFGNNNIGEDETTDLALVVQARFVTSTTSSTLRLYHSEVTYI